jgi:hypothetical protein
MIDTIGGDDADDVYGMRLPEQNHHVADLFVGMRVIAYSGRAAIRGWRSAAPLPGVPVQSGYRRLDVLHMGHSAPDNVYIYTDDIWMPQTPLWCPAIWPPGAHSRYARRRVTSNVLLRQTHDTTRRRAGNSTR